jgi:hypothetical protein
MKQISSSSASSWGVILGFMGQGRFDLVVSVGHGPSDLHVVGLSDGTSLSGMPGGRTGACAFPNTSALERVMPASGGACGTAAKARSAPFQGRTR